MDNDLELAADDYWRHVKEGGDPVDGMRQVAHVYGRGTARRLGRGDYECVPVALGSDESAEYRRLLRASWLKYANIDRTEK